MTLTTHPTIHTPQDAIAAHRFGKFAVDPRLHGFGGLHGGIGLAFAVRAMLDSGLDGADVRSIHARYDGAIRDDAEAIAEPADRRRTVTTARARVVSRGRACITASAIFGRPTVATAATAPPIPVGGVPCDHDEFRLPTEFVPFGDFIEIRPTSPERPFAGADEPRLTAWIRLRDDDTPLDLLRLIVLLDSLAPSAAAPMTEFVGLPTVEFWVRPMPGVAAAASPWMLLDARSTVTTDGWVDEMLTAWAPDGSHLASAGQIRVGQALK